MSVSPESQASKICRSPLQDLYRRKFPEIPEQDLLKIVQKYASDPESCERMLQIESDKGMYGSSPTPDPPTPDPPMSDPPSPLKLLTGAKTRTDGAPPFDLPRSNSTGSAGSSHSSGRSTPVNAIPTPWVVPPRNPAPITVGHGATPITLPPGTVCINGNYYQPVTSTGLVPLMSYSPLSGQQPGQVSSIDKPLGNSPSPSRANETSPNAGYPIYSTNGYFQTNTDGTTPKNQPVSTVSPQTMGPGVSIPTRYFSPASQTQGYTTSYAPTSQFDPRYHTLQGPVVLPVTTLNMSTNAGFRTVSSTSSSDRPQNPATLTADEHRLSNISPSRVATSSAQIDTRFQTNPVRNLGRQNYEPLYVSTSSGMNSPEILRRLSRPNESPEEIQKAFGALGLAHRQPVANDDYLRACLSHQRKRFQKLRKEYAIEKETLEIVIKDISERDGALYDMKYVIAPNPTDEHVARLSEEIDILKITIDEISKNIDRLENGQAFLPPVDSRLHDTQRLPTGSKHKDTFDRSNSVPCLHGEPGRVPPQLSRPLSEHDMNHLLHFDRDRVQYQIKPPTDTTLQDWNFINPTIIPDPIPPNINNIEDETQWSCSRCTFLNHDSLTVCEICGSSRSQ